MQANTDLGTERIHTLLHTHRGKFEQHLTEALAKGWARWAQQVAELHTFCADHENRTKAGKGFFKLNDRSIASVREDLAANYKALADQHAEEVMQILEYGAAELEIARKLLEKEAERLATGRHTIDTVELPDNSQEEAEPKPQEEPVAATSAPPINEPTTGETPDSIPIPVPDATDPDTPLPTTNNSATPTRPHHRTNDSTLCGANTRA